MPFRSQGTGGTESRSVDLANLDRNGAVWESCCAIAQPRDAASRHAAARRGDIRKIGHVDRDRTRSPRRGAADPGRPTLHRLNRAEYANAIYDLLALDVDVADLLPSDDAGYGFDNIGDVLTVSPALLERYLLAAGKISRQAVGDTTMPPAYQTYEFRTAFGRTIA